MKITSSSHWQALVAHSNRLARASLTKLFAADAERHKKFSIEDCGMLYDFSKQKIDSDVLASLCQLAQHCELTDHIKDMVAGKNINKTENRPALHTRLRTINPPPEVSQVQRQMADFVTKVHNGSFLGVTGKRIKHVVSLGIGGSNLGPLMTCEALKAYKVTDLEIHFVANVDADTISFIVEKLPPEQTICLVNSKTFTTSETMQNAETLKLWFTKHLGDKAIAKHMLGITAEFNRAKEFGIAAEHIFTFWDWVGGRYSVWSAIGLSLALSIGNDNLQEFLAGGYIMDEHFLTCDINANLPVLMALVGIWNVNFLQYPSLAVMPYVDGLKHLPAYLQQLEMESNGKSAVNSGGYVNYATAPVIWGGVGCNGQHAYMQLLHQGPQVIPIDFIAAVNSHVKLSAQQNLLLASCLSQSQALMQGCLEESLLSENEVSLAQAKMCPGNRPSSTLLFPTLTPKTLGSLIALYEHKVFVQGVIWQIQSFDQWGVEFSKQLIKQILPLLEQDEYEDVAKSDASTTGLSAYIKKNRHC